MAESGDLDFRSCSQIWIFQIHFLFFFFERWDPDIFSKFQIFKISCSSHSENAHIKLNGFQWVFGGWGDAPFIFFMGRMGQKSKNGPPSCLSTWVGCYVASCRAILKMYLLAPLQSKTSSGTLTRRGTAQSPCTRVARFLQIWKSGTWKSGNLGSTQ